MRVRHVTPILNVSNIGDSLGWFEELGWTRGFTWNEGGGIEGAADADEHGPAGFGSVRCGENEIFLCLDGQGERPTWMSWWLETAAEVDAMHELALRQGMTVTWPPTDEPWGVREFHLQHPDGHTFRVASPARGE